MVALRVVASDSLAGLQAELERLDARRLEVLRAIDRKAAEIEAGVDPRDELLSIAQVAERCHVDVDVVYVWIKRHGLPAFSVAGGRKSVLPSELRAWLRSWKQ